jgi:hypothetical protein
MFERIAYCRIHPAIGIARVGNSPEEYFIGPEIPGVNETPIGGYKDNGDNRAGAPPRVKRQAARFRIFAYDQAGVALGELTLRDAEIAWTVHLVNSKAEGDRFAGTEGENREIGKAGEREFWRNKDIEDRESLIIDPGPRSVAGAHQHARFDSGRFRGSQVMLGDLRTDTEGRLLVLGGFGVSASPNPGQPITDYANNDLWHDDVSDGPVTAKATLKSGRTIDVRPAWVVIAPPDFAPSVTGVVTLYDVATDVALRHGFGSVPDAPGDRPSFTRHVAPIFERLSGLEWVQQGARGAGASASDFADIDRLAAADADTRKALVERFRNPNLPADSEEAKRQATPEFLPALSGDSGDAAIGDPQLWLTVTRTQYDTLCKWRDGNFEQDWTGSFPRPRREITPQGLDRAALEACSGGPFYPGIEGGWLLRNAAAYAEPFRLTHDRLRPGYVTRRMACPWQADFFECNSDWWPTQRPDEVLTLEAYRRLRDVEEELARRNVDAGRRKALQIERQELMAARASWARGLPPRKFEGDVAMIEKWAQHGFVVSADQDGEAFTLPDGRPARVETERGRYDGLPWPEYFHLLTNIEQNADFLPKAKEIARWFFARANYGADENYQPFDYSPEALDHRLKTIYDAYTETMNEPSRMDSGTIYWPVVVGREGDREIKKPVKFEVGRFSDRAVKERLRQNAPFNLVDGAWLQRIQAAGPADDIRAHLFAIWNDEAGNGRVEQNHCNVYDTLLRSLNIYMPPITARQFIEQDLLPAAFIQPVFQLAVSLFPDEFFPEILGMTLYLEWEASPTMMPTVRHYRGRNIDPQFFALHVAIDNITAGHGFIAKEAIKLYLQRVKDEAGATGVREAWRRIWCGYVTWATAGDLGMDLTELCLIIDHKQIDLSYPAMLRVEHVQKPNDLAARLRVAAQGGQADPLSAYLVERFSGKAQEQVRRSAMDASPTQALMGTIVDELNRLAHDGESFYAPDRFAREALGEDTLALLGGPQKDEELVRLNRLLLRDGFAGLIADLPKLEPRWFPDYQAYYRKRFVELIRRKAYAAKPLHGAVEIAGTPVGPLFDNPDELVNVLAGSDLIDIEHPRSSRLFEAMSFSGPMYKIFTEDEKGIILDWIESLQKRGGAQLPPKVSAQQAAAKVLDLIESRHKRAMGVARHGQHQVAGRSLKDLFSNPAGLMEALAHSPEWVRPGDSSASKLYKVFKDGDMGFMGKADEIKEWIDTGAVLVPAGGVTAEAEIPPAAAPMRQHSGAYVPPPEAVAAAPPAVAPEVRKARRDFAAKRKLIGMGAVH